jgi:PHD/YefM family antitoxin component YafN of YafNO toxin-antitoxin module
VLIHGKSGSINNVFGLGYIINAGTIQPDVAGGSFTFGGNGLVANQGTLSATNGDTLTVAASLPVDGSGLLTSTSNGTIVFNRNLSGTTTNNAGYEPLGIVQLLGLGSTAGSPSTIEAMGQDIGAVIAGLTDNFTYGTLTIGNGGTTFVRLLDASDNFAGAGAEAIYVDKLIVSTGATLDLNSLHLYANSLQINGTGTVINGTVQLIPFTATVTPVTSPRNTAVDTIDFTFSTAINATTLAIADLTLTRNGGANLLTGAQTIALVSGNTYRVSNLTALTTPDGNYVLTVNAATVQDTGGNAGFGTGTANWIMDTTAPTVTSIQAVTSPRNTTVPSLEFTFSTALNAATLDFSDLTLTRNGGANLLTAGNTIAFVSGTTYRIDNLTGLTVNEGNYVLTVNATGVQNTLGTAGVGSSARSWTMDTTGPTVTNIVAVTSPRNTSVSTIDFTFSEAINAATLDFNDLTLTRNGGANLLTSGQTISIVSGNTYRISNLASLTTADGAYVLTVIATGVQDPATNAGLGSLSTNWTTETVPPTVTSVEAISSPRNTAVSTIDFTLSETINVATLTFADLTLTRNGGAVVLTAAQSISVLGGNAFRISNLAGLTAADGNYVLTVLAAGIQDVAGNAGTGSNSTSWTMDATAPTVTSVEAITTPRNTAVSTVDFTFSEAINAATLDFNDLTLTRNGGSNLLTSGQTITNVSGNIYRINNLAGLTGADGAYVLTVNATGIQDLGGSVGAPRR